MNFKSRANIPYELVVDGKEVSGSTDGDGQILQAIAPNAKRAKLILEPDTPNQRTIDIKVGHLDPSSTVAGAKQRLANLGYECGDRSDEVTPDFSYALTVFQSHQGLSETGELDDATTQKLNDLHGT
jgi:Putative peptidoglycan binding domain